MDKCFVGSASRIGGSTFDVLATEAFGRHHVAYSDRSCDNKIIQSPGFYHWRSGGEKHINDPLSIANLQVIIILVQYLDGLLVCTMFLSCHLHILFTLHKGNDHSECIFLYPY